MVESLNKTLTSNILVERGRDPSHLVIAFTGFQGALTMSPYDFFSATGLMQSSRILLRDPSKQVYLKGCSPDAPSLQLLIDRLQDEIERLAPDRVTCIGTSSGGMAAMVFGHLLRVDRVQAFAPTIYASALLPLLHGDWHQIVNGIHPFHILRELTLPPSLWKYRDVTRVLRQGNGKTRYTVHVCAHNRPDMARAEKMRSLPQVQITAHDCKTHQVARHLVREGKLLSVFQDVADSS